MHHRRSGGHGASAGRGRRLRHHGRASGRGKRGDCAACQYHRDGRHAGGADSHFRPDLGSAFQSRRNAGRRLAGRSCVARSAWLSGGADCRSVCRSRGGASDVWASRFSAHRATPGRAAAQMFSEFIATFGLLAVIWGCARLRSSAVPFAVGAYITGAYWFTASTSFANPAVTLARSASDTFAGIRPADAPGFIVAQLAGAAAATLAVSLAGAVATQCGGLGGGLSSVAIGGDAWVIKSVY